MRSANNEGIRLLGAILLNISGSDIHGRTYSSNQMTYITDSTDTFYMSRSACAVLGIISDKFPTIGEAFSETNETASAVDLNPEVTVPSVAPCGCPK